jgi:hypothetical protein
MRNKGSKDKHGRYMSIQQLQKKLSKIALELDHFQDQLYRNHSVNRLIDFEKILDCQRHFEEIAKLKIE